MSWPNLLRTLQNRPFRWLVLGLVSIPFVAGYAIDTVQAPLLTGFGGQVDGNVYLRAAAAIAAGRSPYAALDANSAALQGTYIYPPLLAWLLQPLARLPQARADLLLLAAGQALFFAAFAVSVLAFRVRTPWRVFVYLLLWLGFEPNWEDLLQLQVNPLLALGAALWALGWTRGSRLGGLPAGVGVAVKLLLAPLLALPLLRRRWGDLALAAAALAVLSALAEPRWLPDYVLRVLPGLGRGVGSIANLAPAGVAAWVSDPASFYTTAQPASGLPSMIALGAAAAVLAASLWWLRRPAENDLGRGAEAAVMVAALPLLSSVTWPHHATILMVAMVGVLEVAWVRRDPLPALLGGAFWVLLGPGHLLQVNALLDHRADPSVLRAVATGRLQGGWDLAFRAWGLTGPLALVCLWVGALRAARRPALRPAPAPELVARRLPVAPSGPLSST